MDPSVFIRAVNTSAQQNHQVSTGKRIMKKKLGMKNELGENDLKC